MRQRKPITSFPVRICYSVHQCCVCEINIVLGQRYYDGGYGRRAHEQCAENLESGRGFGKAVES